MDRPQGHDHTVVASMFTPRSELELRPAPCLLESNVIRRESRSWGRNAGGLCRTAARAQATPSICPMFMLASGKTSA